MAGYISVKSTAMVVMILLGVEALIEVLEIAFSASQLALLDRAALGLVGDEEADANDTRLQVLAVFKIVTLLVTATFFVMWMSKAHRNLYAFGVPSNYSPAQVGWAFFIPFVNLVRPYSILKLIWQGSIPVEDKLVGRSTQILSAWWGTWIVSGFLDRISGSMIKSSGQTIESLKSATSMGIVASIVRLVAAGLAVRVVDAITKRQESCASGQVAQEFD
jgi:hypothetical protein